MVNRIDVLSLTAPNFGQVGTTTQQSGEEHSYFSDGQFAFETLVRGGRAASTVLSFAIPQVGLITGLLNSWREEDSAVNALLESAKFVLQVTPILGGFIDIGDAVSGTIRGRSLTNKTMTGAEIGLAFAIGIGGIFLDFIPLIYYARTGRTMAHLAASTFANKSARNTILILHKKEEAVRRGEFATTIESLLQKQRGSGKNHIEAGDKEIHRLAQQMERLALAKNGDARLNRRMSRDQQKLNALKTEAPFFRVGEHEL